MYKAFGTKATLLKRVYNVTLVGDAEPIPLVDRPEFAAVLEATDGHGLLRAYAHVGRLLYDRLGDLVATLLEGAAAGDPDLSDFADTIAGERLTGTGGVAARLAEMGALRLGARRSQRCATPCGRSTACRCGACSPTTGAGRPTTTRPGWPTP